MTNEQKNFISQVASAVKKYMSDYNIKVASPIIAQAIVESGWGKSSLAAKYHNYFGLKCGSTWKGKSVNLSTKEEYTAGTITTIKDNFRVFDSLEDGVKGYFDFINKSRYANLKGVTDPKIYVENIKADGYATSSTYVKTILNCINTYGLTSYDVTGDLKVGTTVTIKNGSVYGGLSSTRGKTVPSSQCGSKKHTISKIATHNGIKEALLKEIVSWIAVSSLTAV